MIKDLVEAFNLIRDDPYLNSILNNPQYQYIPPTFTHESPRIRIRPGSPAHVFPSVIDITLINTVGAGEIIISLPHNSEYCDVTEEVFRRLIDPELFIECVNVLFEYKDFFRLEEMSGDRLLLEPRGAHFPYVVYSGEVSRQLVDAQLFCDSAFSLWCGKAEGVELYFGITNFGASELSYGSSIKTTCDESDFINKLKIFLKLREVEPVIVKHEHDAKKALDKLLSVIESNIG